ncbi:MAG: DUF748 domain-containing protein [Candidatus Omnitrophica bacterium]|nr:DUF748 domain-containing protein [Candidatus Omnitrophota bacterium]
MAKKLKVLFLILTILVVIFVVASILVAVYAPKIVEDQLQKNLKVKASLSKISLTLPLTITLEKLEIGDLASIRKISFSPSLISLLFGKIVIHGLNITEPVINLVQTAEGKLNLPVLEQKGAPPAVYLTSLKLSDGKIIFTDKKISAAGYQVIVEKLDASVAKVSLPILSLSTNFRVSAQLATSAGKPFGKIVFSGWLDYLAKDMDAKLTVENMDVANFSPYYGNFISNQKLLSAKLDFDSTFKAKNNALKIITDLNLSQLVYAEQSPEQQLDLDLMKNALDLFTDPQGNLHLVFDIDTQLDNPGLSQDKLKKIVLKAAAKNLSHQSPDQLVDKVSKIIDKYKDYGKQLKGMFSK